MDEEKDEEPKIEDVGEDEDADKDKDKKKKKTIKVGGLLSMHLLGCGIWIVKLHDAEPYVV